MRAVGWGLVGCGDIAAKRVAAALGQAEGSALVAVARARAALAAEFAERHGARRWHADWRDVLTDAEVDAVYLATPVRLHAEQAIAAAEAGKHVLCEKPMALDPAECERMIAAARAHGVRLGVAYYRHHYPVVARLRELLASGEIGEPVLAQAQAFEPFDPGPDHPRAWLDAPERVGRRAHGRLRLPPHRGAARPARAVAEVHGFPDNVRYTDTRGRGHLRGPPPPPQRRGGRPRGRRTPPSNRGTRSRSSGRGARRT